MGAEIKWFFFFGDGMVVLVVFRRLVGDGLVLDIGW